MVHDLAGIDRFYARWSISGTATVCGHWRHSQHKCTFGWNSGGQWKKTIKSPIMAPSKSFVIFLPFYRIQQHKKCMYTVVYEKDDLQNHCVALQIFQTIVATTRDSVCMCLRKTQVMWIRALLFRSRSRIHGSSHSMYCVYSMGKFSLLKACWMVSYSAWLTRVHLHVWWDSG